MIKEGFHPWVYYKEDASNGRYAKPIVQAIRASKTVAVMCSEYAFNSDDVIREINVAGRAKKRMVAVFLDREQAPEELPEDFEFFLAGFPWLFLPNLDDDALRQEIRRVFRN
jgi:hypothetical protein